MAKVGFVKRAEEKYKLLTNGIRGVVDNFLKELAEDKLNCDNIKILFEEEKYNFKVYYKDLEKMNVILTKREEGWVILDFLTPQEFNSINK